VQQLIVGQGPNTNFLELGFSSKTSVWAGDFVQCTGRRSFKQNALARIKPVIEELSILSDGISIWAHGQDQYNASGGNRRDDPLNIHCFVFQWGQGAISAFIHSDLMT